VARQRRKTETGKKKMVNKFLKAFISTFLILVLLIGIGAGTVFLVLKNKLGDDFRIVKSAEPVKKITAFAIFGLDKQEYRTDVIMLAFFNRDTKQIDMVSIPRDTRVKIPDALYEKITQTRTVEQYIKINEVPAYVEEKERNNASVAVLEESFGIEIDYYICMNLDGFKDIVDAVGPIRMEVPRNLHYSDPYQDLYIDIKEGTNYLDGDKAEELVRYRKGYANGDLGRIEMQHLFMSAFMDELLNTDNKMNIISIASTCLKYVDTNFGTMIDYTGYLKDIKKENVVVNTLPGESKNLGRSFFVFDTELTAALFDKIINGTPEATSETAEAPFDKDIKTLNISVQNGTEVAGLASKYKAKLVEEGYKVGEAVDYENKPVEVTKLLVPHKSVGEELKAYFENSVIEVQEGLIDKANQIIIIVGESEDK